MFAFLVVGDRCVGCCRSNDNGGVALGGMESEKEMVRGLDIDSFSKAPAEAMQITLQYME